MECRVYLDLRWEFNAACSFTYELGDYVRPNHFVIHLLKWAFGLYIASIYHYWIFNFEFWLLLLLAESLAGHSN